MKQSIISKDFEGFSRIDPHIKSFWTAATIVDGCIIIDDRIAIPSCLQKAVLSRLHRSHTGQEAMIEASQYIWWPRINRGIVRMCKECKECTLFDSKNLERDVLTAEQRRENCDSRTRVKIVKNGSRRQTSHQNSVGPLPQTQRHHTIRRWRS